MILYKSDVKIIDSIDDVGRVFLWHNRVFRAINENKVIQVQTLLSCGLIDELVEKGFFPKTSIAKDIRLDGFDFLIEHDRIPYITVPSEWSFNMLKDACLAFLEIYKTCRKYGYILKDGHLFNLTFFKNQPIFFDFGSIVRANSGNELYGLYISSIIPMLIWSKGDFYLANLILRDDFSHDRFLPSISLADHKVLQHIMPFSEKYPVRIIRRVINRFGRMFFKRNILAASSISCEKLTKMIIMTKKRTAKTVWSNYHDELIHGIDINSNHRFDRIIEVISNLNLSSMVDLAGNKGCFSLLIAQKTNIKQIYCTDYDESAIDSLYIFIKNNGIKKITPQLLNFICPIPNSSRQELKADIAVALAVTHHAILTQSFNVDLVLRRIGDYSNRFVLVEFMPLGLWNGSQAPQIPDWYNVEWFREKFKEQFTLLKEEQTEPNRIFFLGEKN